MGRFVVRRLIGAAALLVIVPSLSFVMFTVTYTGGPVFPQLRDYLDQTFIERDLGRSNAIGQASVGEQLREGVPVDVALLVGGFVFGIGGGVLAGVRLAKRRRAPLLNAVGAFALAAPVAITAFLILFQFGSAGGDHRLFFVTDQGQYRPLTEAPIDWLRSLWVPWLAVALPVGGAVMRMTASATRDALSDDAVRTAQAKGVTAKRVMRRHTVPFAIPSVSAYVGSAMNIMILNVAIVESIFNLPGSFRYARESLTNVDFVFFQGLTLVTVLYVVAANLLADLVLARVDARTR